MRHINPRYTLVALAILCAVVAACKKSPSAMPLITATYKEAPIFIEATPLPTVAVQ